MNRHLTLKRILIMVFLINTIYSLMWPLSTLYLTAEFGRSLTQIGLVLLGYSAANALGSMAAGASFDRANPWWVVMSGLCGLATVGLIGLLWHSLVGFTVFLICFGWATGWALTTQYALVSYLNAGRDARHDFNVLYLWINLGLVVGTGSLGLLYRGHGVTMVMVVIIGLAVAAALVGGRLPRRLPRLAATVTDDAHNQATTAPSAQQVSVARPVGQLFIALLIVWLAYSQWMTNLSVYVVHSGFTAGFYSRLWVINGIGIVLVQMTLLRHPHVFRHVMTQARWGVLCLAGSFALLLMGHEAVIFIVAMCCLTLGEALFVPVIPVLVDERTSVAMKGRNQGLINVFSSLGKAVGPLIGGAFIEVAGYPHVFFGAVVLLLIAEGTLWWQRRHHGIKG
ncbi:MFS transporter [Furfurilactobacillus entadae]|uniref:MFS transporter n=1 Tax=Furfurilactobacillus entadae TaxID=2922307 RepID=UPI0035EE0425